VWVIIVGIRACGIICKASIITHVGAGSYTNMYSDYKVVVVSS